MRKTLDTSAVFFEIDNGILIATYHPQVKTISLKLAKEIVADRLSFIENKAMPTLVLNHGIIKMDKDARDFLSSESGIEGIKCAAILVNSNFTSLTVTFFLKITKPKLLVKTFTQKKEALLWLTTFID
jgi:hypothetical protein